MWNSDRPTNPGWYWLAHQSFRGPVATLVVLKYDRLVIVDDRGDEPIDGEYFNGALWQPLVPPPNPF